MRATTLLLSIWAAAPAEQPPPRPVGVDLQWSAPAECPDADAFLAATAELVGRALAIDDGAELHVVGRIEAGPDGYALELRFDASDEPPRRLNAARCDLLVDAGSLVVATRLLDALEGPAAVHVPQPAIEPAPAVGTAAPVEPASAPTPVARPAAPAVVAPDRDASRPRRRVRVAATILGGASFGVQPGVAGTLRGDVALLLPSSRVVIGARHGFATTQRAGDFGVRVAATGAHALGCWDPAVGQLDMPVCAGLELGTLVGRGDGPGQTSRTSRQLFATLPVEAGIGWAIVPRFALRAGIGAAIALDRPGFHVQMPAGDLELYRMGAVSVSGMLGLELRLP